MPIYVHFSWLIVFALVFIALVFEEYLRIYPEGNTFFWSVQALFTARLFFASVLLQELSHSLMAKRRGLEVKDRTLYIFSEVVPKLRGDQKVPNKKH